MFGADTDELRRVSDVFDMRTTVVESARRTTTREVESIVWEGRDADAFKQRYASEVASMMKQLEQVLVVHRTDISKQADEQDECSSAGGGGGDNRPWWQRLLDRLKDLAGDALEKIRDLVDAIREHVDFSGNGPRFDFSLSIPGLTDSSNREKGRNFGSGEEIDKDEDRTKIKIGLSALAELFRVEASADLPDGSTATAYLKAGANAFFGYDATHKDGGTEHKFGLEFGASVDAGFEVTRDRGGYMSTSVGFFGSVGPGIELKGQFSNDNGEYGLKGRGKASGAYGGGFSFGIDFDAREAMNDLRNDPGTFFEKIGNDLKGPGIRPPIGPMGIANTANDIMRYAGKSGS